MPPSDVHVLGMKFPPAAMKSSGTQRPVAQAASLLAIAGGTRFVARQCVPGTSPHAGSVDGATTGAPVCGHPPAAPVPVLPVPLSPHPPGGRGAPLPISHTPVRICVSGLMHGVQSSPAAQVVVICMRSD